MVVHATVKRREKTLCVLVIGKHEAFKFRCKGARSSTNKMFWVSHWSARPVVWSSEAKRGASAQGGLQGDFTPRAHFDTRIKLATQFPAVSISVM